MNRLLFVFLFSSMVCALGELNAAELETPIQAQVKGSRQINQLKLTKAPTISNTRDKKTSSIILDKTLLQQVEVKKVATSISKTPPGSLAKNHEKIDSNHFQQHSLEQTKIKIQKPDNKLSNEKILALETKILLISQKTLSQSLSKFNFSKEYLIPKLANKNFNEKTTTAHLIRPAVILSPLPKPTQIIAAESKSEKMNSEIVKSTMSSLASIQKNHTQSPLPKSPQIIAALSKPEKINSEVVKSTRALLIPIPKNHTQSPLPKSQQVTAAHSQPEKMNSEVVKSTMASLASIKKNHIQSVSPKLMPMIGALKKSTLPASENSIKIAANNKSSKIEASKKSDAKIASSDKTNKPLSATMKVALNKPIQALPIKVHTNLTPSHLLAENTAPTRLFSDQVLPQSNHPNPSPALRDLPVIPVGKTAIDKALASSMDRIKPAAAGSLAAHALPLNKNLVDKKIIRPVVVPSITHTDVANTSVAITNKGYEQINLNKPLLMAAIAQHDEPQSAEPVLTETTPTNTTSLERTSIAKPAIGELSKQKIEQIVINALAPLSTAPLVNIPNPIEMALDDSLLEKLANGGFNLIVPKISDFSVDTIQRIVGIKGKFDTKENLYKISVPRDDLNIIVNGVKLTSGMGLTSWVDFYKNDGATSLQGNIVLTEEEVNSVVYAAIENNLNVTELHNHYLWESPKVIFMHIEAVGPTKKLAEAVNKLFAKIKETQQGNGEFPLAVIDTANTTLNPHKIETILGTKAALMDGVYKVQVAQAGEKSKNATLTDNDQKINSSAIFAGSDDEAVLDGDLAMKGPALQKVLIALHRAKISIVSINQRMTDDQTRYVVLHYWGVGNTANLAKGLRAAIEASGQKS